MIGKTETACVVGKTENNDKFSVRMWSKFLEQVAFKVCFVVAEL